MKNVFVGYTEDPNTYFFRNSSCLRFWQKSRDVTFFEDCFLTLNNRNVKNTNTR